MSIFEVRKTQREFEQEPIATSCEEHITCQPKSKYRIVMLFPVEVLTDHQPVGDGLVAFSFISQLASRGHELHVIAQRVAIRSFLPPNIHIYQIGPTERGLRQKIEFLTASRRIVRHLLTSGSIDVVQQMNPVSTGMSLGMIGLGVPIILGTFVSSWAFKAANPELYRRLFKQRKLSDLPLYALTRSFKFAVSVLQERYASAFLVTTSAALSRFTSVDRVLSRVHWIPHGIDLSMFTPASSANAERSILFVGAVATHKGILSLLDAFEIINTVLPDVILKIAGNGPLLADVTARVSSMPSGARICLLGPLDRSAVAELMSHSTVFCQPSFGEPYATVVLEAMACGRPVVATDSGGLAEMIDDDGGRRVRAGDSEALAKAIIEILNSRELQEQMGKHNREVAERYYDWPRIIDKLEAIYGDVSSDKVEAQV